MMGLNRVVVAGNLTRDPEARVTQAQRPVADMGLAINERYKTSDGEYRDQTCFVEVVIWGRQAEVCAQHLRKGSGVVVEGRLQYDEWEARDGSGQRRNKLRVRADKVIFLDKHSGETDG